METKKIRDPRIFDRLHKINRINIEIDSIYHTAALKLGLSDSAQFILYMIYENGGSCPLYDISCAGLCKQTVNSALRKLEREDILYLENNVGRAKTAVLTEKGRRFAEDTVGRLLETEELAMSDWTDEEIDTFLMLNEKYRDCLKARLEEL